MAVTSAGLLLHRPGTGGIEVFLVHPGGPFWAAKDLGAWSIPKGIVTAGEEPLAAARREVAEETGYTLDVTTARPLGALRQPRGKTVIAWALATDLDAGAIRSNTVRIEWPKRSGRIQEFPEVDRAAWFGRAEAARRILPGQLPFLDALDRLVAE